MVLFQLIGAFLWVITAFVLFSPTAILLPSLGFGLPIEGSDQDFGKYFSLLVMLVPVGNPWSLKPTTSFEWHEPEWSDSEKGLRRAASGGNRQNILTSQPSYLV